MWLDVQLQDQVAAARQDVAIADFLPFFGAGGNVERHLLVVHAHIDLAALRSNQEWDFHLLFMIFGLRSSTGASSTATAWPRLRLSKVRDVEAEAAAAELPQNL